MSARAWVLERGLSMVHDGEKYWLDVHPETARVSIDLQHHGMMGQPGELERVGEGLWREGIVERTGTLSSAGFEAAEARLRESLARARAEN